MESSQTKAHTGAIENGARERPDNRLLQLLNEPDFALFERHMEWFGARPDQIQIGRAHV